MAHKIKYGFGEVEPTDSGNSISILRMMFQDAISDIAPQVLETLSDKPFKLFLQLEDEEARREVESYLAAEMFDEEPYTRCKDMAECLRQWARGYNLEVYWMLARALNTLDSWRRYPYMHDNLQWTYGGNAWFRLNMMEREKLPAPPLGLPEWDADYDMQEVYERGAKEYIEKNINQSDLLRGLCSKTKRALKEDADHQISIYCKQVLDVYLSEVNELGQPMWKRADRRSNIKRDLRWAIMYQVLEQKSEEIADQPDVAHTTVLRAVDSILQTINLPKRPDAKPGRPTVEKESLNSWRRMTERAFLPKK